MECLQLHKTWKITGLAMTGAVSIEEVVVVNLRSDCLEHEHPVYTMSARLFQRSSI